MTGTFSDLRLTADFALPDGGRFAANGTLDLASREKGYDLSARLFTLNLRTIDSKAPVTSLTARVAAHGLGVAPETMRAAIAADLSTSLWDSVAVDTAAIRANIGGGLVRLQKLYLAGGHAVASATGSFGLARDRRGTLTFRAAVDSLGALNRWLPRSASSVTAVSPRPGVVARAVARARADSARIARATEMQRLISGVPPPKLVVNAPKPVPADTVSGSAYAAGTLTGNIHDFDLRGRAGGENVVVRGNYARRFRSEFAWRNARAATSTLAVGLDADSLSIRGFAFDTLHARLTHAPPGGHVEVAVVEDQHRQYSAAGDYALYRDRKELRIADMRFRFDTAYWSMRRPSTIEWGGPGIRVTAFELRNRGNGRLYANGLLPTEGMADVRLDVDNFPLSNITDIAQTDIAAGGVFTLHGTLTGTSSAPAFRGAFGVTNGVYNGTPVPEIRGTFGYAGRELVAHLDALRPDGRPMTTAGGRVPVDLAFTGVTGNRLLARPMSVDVVGDSLPIDLIPQFTNLVTNVHGRAAGRVALRGTARRPSLTGGVVLDHGTVTIASTGATVRDVGASLRMARDTVFVDSLAGWARGPVRVRGTLDVKHVSEPGFDLYLLARGAELLDDEYGRVRVDAGVALTGPFRGAYLSGAVTVTQGVIYAPEPEGRHVIGAGDPALFNVLDTAAAGDRDLFPPRSPLLADMRMEITLGVDHNTWVRNREANVEIYTDDPLSVRAEQQAFTITGVVTTERGEYDFMSKRFQVKRGSATFIGSPDLNPTLQITGEYQVQVASRGALNIRVLVGGTLRKPRLSLESDAQPPRTQSELLSLLAFGQSTTTLLASGSSSIAGSAATSDLFGVGAQLAAKRLAGVALGTAVDQLEVQAGRAFGTDVFDITPGDVPSGNVVGNILTQTKFEAGKYVDPRTFLNVQEQAARLGLGIEYRTGDGWRFNANIAPRILLGEPRLSSQPFRTVQTYGGFVIKEWRF